MPWYLKLLIPVAIKLVEKYVLNFIEDKWPDEAQLATEITAYISAHIKGQTVPSDNLTSAAQHFDRLC